MVNDRKNGVCLSLEKPMLILYNMKYDEEL